MEFELANFDIVVRYVSHDSTKTHPYNFGKKLKKQLEAL